ncbi:MAG: ferrous iron transport protein A [FCB group bacterium]|nr:ferrous iron transport protein A [FCB group bacterium]
MTIIDLKIGSLATIDRIDGADDFTNRLADMGLGPQVPVRVIRVAPGGSPYLLKINDFYISIRRDDAARIRVVSA